jgi:hypothetical protein
VDTDDEYARAAKVTDRAISNLRKGHLFVAFDLRLTPARKALATDVRIPEKMNPMGLCQAPLGTLTSIGQSSDHLGRNRHAAVSIRLEPPLSF